MAGADKPSRIGGASGVAAHLEAAWFFGMKSPTRSASARKWAAATASKSSGVARGGKANAGTAKALAVVRIGRSPNLVVVLRPATRPTKVRQSAIRAAVKAVVSGAESP